MYCNSVSALGTAIASVSSAGFVVRAMQVARQLYKIQFKPKSCIGAAVHNSSSQQFAASRRKPLQVQRLSAAIQIFDCHCCHARQDNRGPGTFYKPGAHFPIRGYPALHRV